MVKNKIKILMKIKTLKKKLENHSNKE